MVLKAVLSQAELDGLPDDLKKEYSRKSGEHYRDDKFYLDVAPTEGFSLEPVEALKSALSKERKNASDANYQLKQFEGLSAQEARDALKKLEELKDAPTKDKIEALVEDRVKQWKEKNQNDLAAKDTEISALLEALEDETINARAIAALNKHNGNIDLLLPHILTRARVVRIENDGKVKFVPRIVDPSSGQDLLTKKTGSTDFMDIEELVSTMKDNNTFAAGFTDVDASGFDTDSGKQLPAGHQGKKVIKADDQDALNANMEGIARGEVIVVD